MESERTLEVAHSASTATMDMQSLGQGCNPGWSGRSGICEMEDANEKDPNMPSIVIAGSSTQMKKVVVVSIFEYSAML